MSLKAAPPWAAFCVFAQVKEVSPRRHREHGGPFAAQPRILNRQRVDLLDESGCGFAASSILRALCVSVVNLCFFAFTLSASAETLTLAGRTVVLEPPQGYCALDAARPQEAELIAFNERMQQPRNHVIMQLADCDELAEFRAGKRQNFGKYGQYFTPVSNGAVKLVTSYARADFLADAAKELPKLDSGALVDEVTKKVRENAGADVGGVKFLGVLKEDDAGVYMGIAFGNLSVGNQSLASSSMGVVGLTLVNQVSVSLGLYRVNVGPEAIPDLLAGLQRTMASVVAANATNEARESPRIWHGINIDELGQSALIGGLIGAAIGLVGWVWSRWRKSRPQA